MYKGYLTDVKGIKVGHAQDFENLTGVTVILPEYSAVAGVDVRGGAPGTRETDLLKSENLIDSLNAIVLSGGSAYGLEASSGVMKFLEEEGIGFDVQVAKVPTVAQAVIFDLDLGSPFVRPDLKMGYEAAKNATYSENRQGNIGAGVGANVGKILGNDFSIKSGVGSATIQCGDLIVSAMTVLNAFGDIFDWERGEKIAGVYHRDNRAFLDTMDILGKKSSDYNAFQGKNTTISVVATNARLTKPMCNKVSSMAHNGYAMSIYPVHTMFDGDTIFTLSTGEIDADISFVGALASKAIARAVANAVYTAEPLGGLISNKDLV